MIPEKFVDYIGDSIRKNWEITALSDYKGESFTFASVGEYIYKFHMLFEKTGIKKGDKIALVGKNSARWCIVYLAVTSYGAVIVPILPDFTPEDIITITNHSDSLILLSSDAIFQSLDIKRIPALKGTVSLNTYGCLNEQQKGFTKAVENLDKEFAEKYAAGFNADIFKLPDIQNEDLAVISYTSGTTGFSKGVMLQHNSLAANVRYAQNNMPLKPGDAIVSFLPLAHTYGCAFEFLFPFSIGCHVTILTKTPSPQIIMQAFQEVRPRLILSVPLVIEKIYKAKLLPVISKRHMKVLLKVPGINNLLHKKIRETLVNTFGGNFAEIVIGGAAFNSEAELFFKKIKFPFSVGYGMTECGPLISYAPWNENKIGASGRPVDTLEVSIDSKDPANEVGEIILRGENVMTGYYKNQEATNAIIDSEGWLHTGDLGIIDRDKFVFIKGRSKSLILGSSGRNIYPEEIEDAINNRYCVAESVVVQRGEKLVALIYPDKETIEKHNISEAELQRILDQHRIEMNRSIPAYKNVAKFEIHNEEFVKTPKRSIKRYLYK
jgi:long-chain acyl-CoA synthetase